MNLLRFIFVILPFSLCACSENAEENISEEDEPILSYTDGHTGYMINLYVINDIFQYAEPAKNSPQEKINKLLLSEFEDYEKWVLESFRETAKQEKPFYRGELRAMSEVYINEANFLSVKNRIYAFNNGAHGVIKEQGRNFKILPNGNVVEIKLADLFQADKPWLEELLKTSIMHLAKKYGEDSFWDSDAQKVIDEALKSDKKKNYINSFVLTKNDTIILIFEPLSLMPNIHGMPIIEIPTKEIKFYKGVK